MATKFLAVIHAENEMQVLRNIDLARKAEADGVFLINHSCSAEELVVLATLASREHVDYWLGLNRLGHKWSRIFDDLPPSVQGVWADDGRLEEYSTPDDARTIQVRRQRWGGRYFGGVAFKTQKQVSDEQAARYARWAITLIDIITTSGPSTGSPPTPSKIKAMREVLPPKKELAIASGITPENVRLFTPYVDYVLVATGVSDSFTELSLSRMKALVEAIREA